jgi:hypothetical protein
MACIHYVTKECLLPGGEKLVRGKLTLGSYAASGATLNLANYFKSTEAPTVITGPVANATNVAFPTQVNVTNAETITVLALCGGLGASEPLYYLNAGFELTSQNCDFYAIGQAY